MICPKCGKENTNNARFCKYCGTPLRIEYERPRRSSVLLKIVGVLSVLLIVSGTVLLLLRVRDNKKNKTVETSDQADYSNTKPEEESTGKNTTQSAEGKEENVDTVIETGDEAKEEEAEKLAYEFPSGALEYNGHHYYIYNYDAEDWSEAFENCKDRGGYLAVINDEEENEELFKYMIKNGFDSAFFGMTDSENEGEWKYLYGDSSTFVDWGTNSIGVAEPNNADGGESHVELDSHMLDGHWNDAEFGRQVFTPEGKKYIDKSAYICEWDQ